MVAINVLKISFEKETVSKKSKITKIKKIQLAL